MQQAATDDIVGIVSTGECSVNSTKPLPCTKVVAREARSILDQLLSLEAIELGECVHNAVSTIFAALCEGLKTAINRSRSPAGRLPKVLETYATDIMESLAVVIEVKLPKHLSSSEHKLGKVCAVGKMEAKLGMVADALDLELS